MISDELKDLLIQVITSWQVIAITLALILYFSLVSYVAKFRPKKAGGSAVPKAKPKKAKAPSAKNKEAKENKDEQEDL